jgi:hypothetical protein
MGLRKMKTTQELMAETLQILQKNKKDLTVGLEQFRKDLELITYYKEYQAWSEEFQAAMSLEDYCTIKCEDWPRDWNKDSLKSTRQKLKGDEREGQGDWLEVHASSHVEDVCNEDDKPSFLDTPLEPAYEVVNISTHDGDVDSTQDEVFQSAGVDDSMPYPIYDTYDDEGVIAPEHDEFLGVDEFPLDVDLSSQELCIKDDKGEDDFGERDCNTKNWYVEVCSYESHHLTGN